MTRPYLVELARTADIPALPRIEREAVTLFEPGCIPASVLEETTPIEELQAAYEAGRLWAREAGHSSITLTTFRDVPWNAPFYAQLGFRTLATAELTPGLEVAVQNETARGFDPSRRVAMRCDLERAP